MSVVVSRVLSMSSVSESEDDLLPARPASKAVFELIIISLLGLFIAFILGSGGESPEQAILRAPVAGAVVLQHIGWAFGVYIPILLGFYAIVIGGQLVVEPATAAKTRRRLGFVAELIAGAFVPALALVIAACVDDPRQAGALFVILPAAAVVFFLAVQLGGFIVFERALRLATADRTRDWAKQRLEALKPRSSRPIWMVVVAHAVIGGLVGFVTALVTGRSPSSILVLTPLYSGVAFVLAFAGATGVYFFDTAQDRVGRIMAWPLSVGVYIAGIVLAFDVADASPAAGVSVLLLVIFSAASVLMPRRSMPRFLLNWTIQGATAGYAALTIASHYVRTVREIQVLRPKPDADRITPLKMSDRISAAADALRQIFPVRAA